MEYTKNGIHIISNNRAACILYSATTYTPYFTIVLNASSRIMELERRQKYATQRMTRKIASQIKDALKAQEAKYQFNTKGSNFFTGPIIFISVFKFKNL